MVIIGFGWVGQANALALRKMGCMVYYFDPGQIVRKYDNNNKTLYDQLLRLESPLEKDTGDTSYIVCVGDRVSESGEQDISSIKKALESLKDAKGKVFLRSTILPEHLSQLKFNCYLPEFLHERKAVEECLYPHYLVLGKRNLQNEPGFIKLWRARAVKVFEGTPEEASYIKYLSNIWNSIRIAFVNEFGDAMAVPKDKEALHSIEKIIDFLFEGKSYLRYGRSFGGHCLPKDTRAFIHSHKAVGRNVSLINGAYISNTNHKDVEESCKILPEWYSEWVRPELSGRKALMALASSVKRRIKKFRKKIFTRTSR